MNVLKERLKEQDNTTRHLRESFREEATEKVNKNISNASTG